MTDWAVDSNDAFKLSMVRAKEDKESLAEEESYEAFHPAFTYPIYGEDEKIYGYKDLEIDLRFASGSLTQYLNVSFSEKLAASTADDPKTTLCEFIPEGYITDEAEFLKHVEDDATTFRPSGRLIHEYTRPSPSAKGKGKGSASARALDASSEDVVEYEVYHTTWNTPGFREYHRKMQLFILLYIEGGSYIQEDEDTWEFVVLFEKRKRKSSPNVVTYHFMGYSSLYPFYHYPESHRMRLSQFVILPPYQRAGHGSELYNAIYRYVVAQANIAELTVEDPAEAFEDLRDKNDLIMLLSHEQFMKEAFGESESYGGGRVGGVGKAGRAGKGGLQKSQAKGKLVPPSDRMWLEKWRKDLKIALRQCQRLTEMLILFKMDVSDPRVMRAYRLQVKERLYRFNFEILAQMDKEERHEKLEETFQSVKEDYHRILALVS